MKKVYLVQTDTTVGFLSKDYKRLNKLKKRPLNTPCIKSVGEFSELKQHVRVPKKFRNFVRKADKITFIYPNNQALRVITTKPHSDFLKSHKWLYSTSANITKQEFNENFAISVADEVIFSKNGFFVSNASKMYKLGRKKLRRVR